MTEIETERLLLCGWRDGDLGPYARRCADPEVMRCIGSGTTLTREQSWQQIEHFAGHWEEHGFGLWAIEERATGTLAGFVGLARQGDWAEGPHKTEVGWRLGRAFWRRSLAMEGAKAAVAFGFEGLGLEGIISIIQPGNAASRRVAEKAGLSPRGEILWRNDAVVWYVVDRAAWRAARGSTDRDHQI